MFNDTGLDLTVQVPADEWAWNQRRLIYLETLLLRILREKERIQEWYTASEIAGMRLPGVPGSHAGITRKATSGNWPRISALRQGRRCFVYHVSGLPARAFDALIARLLDLPEMDADVSTLFDLPPVPPPSSPRLPDNTAPPWVLPLMRLMKGEAQGNLGVAWQALPAHLPCGMALPSVDEAAEILVTFGLA